MNAATLVTSCRAALVVPLLLVLPHRAWCDALPASVTACLAQVDREARLNCYDREISRFVHAPPPAAPSAPTAPVAAAAPAVIAAPTEAAPSPAVAAPAAPRPPAGVTVASEPRHIRAHVTSSDSVASVLTVHLDNGQTWRQVQGESAYASVRPGDPVSIDRSLGAYWLTGPDGVAVKVEQQK